MATDRPAPKPTKIVEIPDRDMIKERKTSKEPTKKTQKRRRYGHRSGRHGARTEERERFFTIFTLGLIFSYWRERGE
jgi:ribosomal protein L19E